jgi:hypothetical protein
LITLDEFMEMTLSPAERLKLYPLLDDEALAWVIDNTLLNCRRPLGQALSYDEVLQNLAAIASKRLQECHQSHPRPLNPSTPKISVIALGISKAIRKSPAKRKLSGKRVLTPSAPSSTSKD